MLSFKGRRHDVWGARYTGLFFLDEVTALQDIKHWLTQAQKPFDPDPGNPQFVQLQAIAGQVYNDVRPTEGPSIATTAIRSSSAWSSATRHWRG